MSERQGAGNDEGVRTRGRGGTKCGAQYTKIRRVITAIMGKSHLTKSKRNRGVELIIIQPCLPSGLLHPFFSRYSGNHNDDKSS